jgi:hypothetical protein
MRLTAIGFTIVATGSVATKQLQINDKTVRGAYSFVAVL